VKPTPETTLREARAWLQVRLAKGEECPCCRRWAKVNVYSISATAARALILLVVLYMPRRTWVHSKEVAAAHSGVDARKMLACTGDGLTKLRHWGLVRPKANESDPTKRDLGLWEPTPKGIDFVYGRIRVAKYAHVYNDKLLGLDKRDTVSIREALRDRFNYEQLMAHVADESPDLERDE
jgi:hypothetical protein